MIEGVRRETIRTIVKGLYNRDAVVRRPSPPAIVGPNDRDCWQYRATDVGMADLERAYKEAQFRIESMQEAGLINEKPTGQTAA